MTKNEQLTDLKNACEFLNNKASLSWQVTQEKNKFKVNNLDNLNYKEANFYILGAIKAIKAISTIK